MVAQMQAAFDTFFGLGGFGIFQKDMPDNRLIPLFISILTKVELFDNTAWHEDRAHRG